MSEQEISQISLFLAPVSNAIARINLFLMDKYVGSLKAFNNFFTYSSEKVFMRTFPSFCQRTFKATFSEMYPSPTTYLKNALIPFKTPFA